MIYRLARACVGMTVHYFTQPHDPPRAAIVTAILDDTAIVNLAVFLPTGQSYLKQGVRQGGKDATGDFWRPIDWEFAPQVMDGE